MKVFIGRYPKDPEKERTVRVRIDRQDTWNMDSTLAFIIVPMLKQLKETKHGAPHVEDKDVPVELWASEDTTVREEWDTDKFWFDRWDWVMDEMIWAFEQHLIDWEDQYHTRPDAARRHESGEWHTEPCKDNPEMSEIVWDKEPKVDLDGMKSHSERMQNGFRLFGKYYSGLWD